MMWKLASQAFPANISVSGRASGPEAASMLGVQHSVFGGQAFPCAGRHAIPCMSFPSPPGPATSCWRWRVLVTNIRDFSMRKQPRSTFALGLLPVGLRQGIVEGAPPGWESHQCFRWHSLPSCVWTLWSQGPPCSQATRANNRGSQTGYSVTKICVWVCEMLFF